MKAKSTKGVGLLFVSAVFLSCAFVLPVVGQTPAPPQPRRTPLPNPDPRVIVENKTIAPQVVTILHRLNGLKVIGLLVRSKEEIEAIEQMDHGFDLASEIHTNVIAGLALDDGHTIAAWLPEAEAELPPMPPAFVLPRVPRPPRTPNPATPEARVEVTPQVTVAIPRMPAIAVPRIGTLFDSDLRIVTRDGKRLPGRYIGIDGLTGLSLITLNEALPAQPENKEEPITVGQRLRVIGPQPAPVAEVGTRTALYVRIGETDGVVVNVMLSPSGSIARVRVRSPRFTPENIGGIAVNEKNQTLGIVTGVEGNEATIVPIGLVRLAAKRVIERQASVPRPWLGIRGEPIGSISLDRIMRVGWELEKAKALAEKRQGILLTSVAPGSPAALAKLKVGDVILSVNDGFIRNAEEFSWSLDEASQGEPVHFEVARPETGETTAFEIKLSESNDPLFGWRAWQKQVTRVYKKRSPLGEGVETVALKPRVANRFGANGGLLVISVQPETEAFKAGLRPGDLVESINGQQVFVTTAESQTAPIVHNQPSTCIVVRNKEKITLKINYQGDPNEEKGP